MVVATSKYGVAAISDSAGYVSVARSFAEGRGFMDWKGGAGAETPPLYPAVLALFEMVGVDALIGARWLNATLLAGLVLVAGFSLRELTGRASIPALVAFGPSRYALGTVRYARRHGAGGIASEKWQKSGTIAHLERHVAAMRSEGALIYSNEPTAIYLLTDLRSVYWLPPHDNPYSPVPAHVALETFAQALPKREPTYIVLFDEVLQIFSYPRALLEGILPLDIIHSARDGVIYRVRFSGSDTGLVPPAGAMTSRVARGGE